jgi:hypothetical protein
MVMFFFFFVPPTKKKNPRCAGFPHLIFLVGHKKKKARRLKPSGRCASRCRRACLNSGFVQALKHADKLLPPATAMLTDAFNATNLGR